MNAQEVARKDGGLPIPHTLAPGASLGSQARASRAVPLAHDSVVRSAAVGMHRAMGAVPLEACVDYKVPRCGPLDKEKRRGDKGEGSARQVQ
ncbi:hypothetical protein HPP92_021623 [Vanilla planifolia]|uniref:Uncharacterized protein n=1 Tax=Vanilla planifolia TaxID=51239 RepID=A0A835UIQ4_VANPL|nr:hypothetical protein HPP92_021623 [Vanilla planifolia]